MYFQIKSELNQKSLTKRYGENPKIFENETCFFSKKIQKLESEKSHKGKEKYFELNKG